jgi:hypothetical protein
MAKVKVNKKSVNEELYIIFNKYKEATSKHEIFFDTLVPLLLSIICIGSVLFFSRSSFLELIKDLNNSSLAVLSILAGFNTASLAVISSSKPEKFVEELKGEHIKEGKELLSNFLSFFTYAIVVQLLLLVVGLIGMVLLKIVPPDAVLSICLCWVSLAILTVLWFSVIIHSLFVTIRNVVLLSRFIQFMGNTKKD